MDCDEIHDRTVSRLMESIYHQPLINNAERGAYVEHLIVLALGEQWRLTWPWASWDIQHRADHTRIEVKQSAARQPWHQRPVPKALPRSFRGWLGIKKPSNGYYSEDGEWKETRPPQRHADIYVFAWHPVKDLRNADRRLRADHRRPDQWRFFVVAEGNLPEPKDGKTDGITPSQLGELVRDVSYEELAGNVAKVQESLGGKLKADVEDSRRRTGPGST